MNTSLISMEEAMLKLQKEITKGWATIHEETFNDNGLAGRIILEGRWNFLDFVKEDNNLSEYSEEVLGAYDFETKYTSNYHWAFENSTYITLHQLNYGIDIPDISNEGDLYNRLEERIEFNEEYFKNKNEKLNLMSLFYEVINLFYDTINQIDYSDI